MPTPTATPDGSPASHLPAELELPTTREGLRAAATKAREGQQQIDDACLALALARGLDADACRKRHERVLGITEQSPESKRREALWRLVRAIDRAEQRRQSCQPTSHPPTPTTRPSSAPVVRGRSEARPGASSRKGGSRSRTSSGDDTDGESPRPRPRGLTEFPARYAGSRSCPVCSDPIPEYDPDTGRKKRTNARTCGKASCQRKERRDRRREEANRKRRTRGQYIPFKIGCGCIDRRPDGLPRTPYVDEDAFLRCRDCERLATQRGKVVELVATYLRRYDRAQKLDGKAPPLNPDTDLVPLEARKLRGEDLQRTWAGDRLSCATWRGWLDASLSDTSGADTAQEQVATGDPRDPRNPLRERVLENRGITLRTFPKSGHRIRPANPVNEALETLELPTPNEAEVQRAAEAHGDDLEEAA